MRTRTIAAEETIDHLLIQCDPETPVMAYASLFLPNATHALTEVARLNTTALAINSSDLLDAFVHRRAVTNVASACFIAEQLEFVGNIILEGTPDDPDFKLARAISLTLNPRAQVSELSASALERLFDDTRTSFDFAEALDGARWRKLIDTAEPACGQNNITAFAYRARRPFHPLRFWDLLQESPREIFRAKGFFWLATRMDLVGGLNLAGAEMRISSAGEWWAARDDHTRQHQMPARTLQEWQEPFGDRRQAIALMGINFDSNTFREQVDACLLTDAEMAAGQDSWQTLTDPFPSWSAHSHSHGHEHECNHDHESGDDECCHH